MPGPGRSLISRALVQMDRAFWCLHDFPMQVATLGIPTLVSVAAWVAALVFVVQRWKFDEFSAYFVYGVGFPTVLAWILTFAPLPVSIFVWSQAEGVELTPGECFRATARRSGALAWLAVRLLLLFLVCMLPFWVIFLGLWPRTSLMPVILQFEGGVRLSRRSRQLLREDSAVYLLAFIFLLITIALGIVLFIPRAFLQSGLWELESGRLITDRLWIFETAGLGVLLSMMAVSWCMSITLVYHDIRFVREGEELRLKVGELRRRLLDPLRSAEDNS